MKAAICALLEKSLIYTFGKDVSCLFCDDIIYVKHSKDEKKQEGYYFRRICLSDYK